jgi:ubiquinone biosynthesis monooxygenase Coq7
MMVYSKKAEPLHTKRHYSFIDKLCIHADQALRAISGAVTTTDRPYPAKNITEPVLTESQRKQHAALMRVNHAGEVCAQALYHSQGLVSHNPAIREKMQQAAIEEGDHLAWCQQRLTELNSHTSYLNPFWYTGSFLIGLLAGKCGDQYSLGFLAETEQQVVNHLEKHISTLSAEDQKSFNILQQMQADEASHRDDAKTLGAKELPKSIKKLMALTSKIMVKIAYWI